MSKVVFSALIFSCAYISSEVLASSEVSLDLAAYVDSEVNIERIDDGEDCLDIFSQAERRYRVTSNVEKNVKVTFQSQNEWKLKHESNDGVFIPYKGIFRGNNHEEVVEKKSNVVELKQDEFSDQEYEFLIIFKAIGSMKDFSAGKYSDRVTISVSSSC